MSHNRIPWIAGILGATLAVLIAASPALAATAPNRPMSLADAVSYALDHSQTIAQNRASVAQAYDSLGKERIAALPTVNGSLQNSLAKSSNYGGSFAIIGAQQQQQFSQNTAQIGTQYTLQTGGLALLQLDATRAQLQQARETLASAENQLATSVTNAFYTVVQKQAIVTVDRSDLNYQDLLVKFAKVKERAGVAAGVDVLKAQVAQAKSNSTLVGAQADVLNATELLAQTIGAPLRTVFAFPKLIATPALPSQPVNALVAIALAMRPDVKAAQDALQAASYTRKGFDRELFPQVQLGASFGNQLTPTNKNFLIGANGQPVIGPDGQPVIAPRVGSPGFWSLSATSTFTLPLVDYGARHLEKASDNAQISSAQASLNAAQTQVRIDVVQSYRAAKTALVQLGYASDESRLGSESARISQLQYQNGLIALSDVLLAQQQSVAAQSDYVNAKVAYVNAVVKLRVSLGTYTARSAVADLR